MIPPSVFALLNINCKFEYHHPDERINNGNDAANHVKIWCILFSNPKNNVAYLCNFVRLMNENQPTDLHSSRWHSQMQWMIGMLMDTLKLAIIYVRLV